MKLQKPAYIYCKGAVRPEHEAVLHVSAEGVVRGLNVFEGLKGYWQPDGTFGIVALPRHHARLKRSARLMRLPFEMDLAVFEDACHAIVGALASPEKDMWVRATLYATEGHWGEGTKTDLVLTAYHQDKRQPPSWPTGVSAWRRACDNALPARIKTSANYFAARMARIEGRDRGYPEMVLLNEAGRVAEFIGSCLVIARDGRLFTPPASEGALESITVDIVEALARDMGIPFERRPIDRSELLIADEIAAVGTLDEVTTIQSIDGLDLPEPQLLAAVAARYRAAATGVDPHPAIDLSRRPVGRPPVLAGHRHAVAAE